MEEIIWQQFDMSQIQEVMDSIFPKQNFSFTEMVKGIVSGDIVINQTFVINVLKETIFSEFESHRYALLAIFTIAIFTAIFSAMGSIFESHQIADMSYYAMFLLLFTLLIQTFSVTSKVAYDTINNLVDFMRALIPAYSLSVGMASGASGAAAFAAIAIFMISFATECILKIMLPMIQIFMILSLVNHLAGGDYLKQITELLKSIILFLSKTMIGVAVGINFIQGMIAPVIDSVKKGVLTKAVSMIPGMGGITDSVTEVVMGSAILVKNGIGIAGLMILVLACMSPLLKLLVFYLMYKGTAAVLSPIAHKNITEGISEVGDGTILLLRAVMTALILFIITLAIIMMTTNRGIS
jgi:stage III sporulation protein AE